MWVLIILRSFSRKQDFSIGFGAPVHANMRIGGSTKARNLKILDGTVSKYSMKKERSLKKKYWISNYM